MSAIYVGFYNNLNKLQLSA